MGDSKILAKNTFFNYSSKIVSAGVGFLYTLIISNFLGPENYGIYNYLPSVLVGFFTLFGGTFLNNLLWVFTAREKGKNLFKKILFIEISLMLIIISIINLAAPTLMKFVNVSHIDLLPIASVFVLFIPLNTIFITLFKGFDKFGKVLQSALIENILTLAFSAIFIIGLGWGLTGAFIARFIALAISILFYIYHYKKLPFSGKQINFKEVKKYSGWNIIANFIREGHIQISNISIGLFLNAHFLGIKYLGDKIANLVIYSPSVSIAEIMFSKNSSNYKNFEIIASQTSRAIKSSFIISIILGVILYLISELFIKFLFPSFIDVIPYVSLFILAYVLQSQSPMLLLFDAINKTKRNVQTNLLMLIMVIFIALPATYFFGILGLLIADAITIQIRYFFMLIKLKKEGIRLDIIPRTADVIFLTKFFIQFAKNSLKK
ncbi:MAG: oligosaccharide flippase family protein [Candidatus Diapherotrites archaeon]|nr:oligosaccharide flippase family protein [Candidatus Diapherotrites archaeon]